MKSFEIVLTPLEYILSLTIGQALVIVGLLAVVYVAGKISMWG